MLPLTTPCICFCNFVLHRAWEQKRMKYLPERFSYLNGYMEYILKPLLHAILLAVQEGLKRKMTLNNWRISCISLSVNVHMKARVHVFGFFAYSRLHVKQLIFSEHERLTLMLNWYGKKTTYYIRPIRPTGILFSLISLHFVP